KTPPATRPRPTAKRRRNCSWRLKGEVLRAKTAGRANPDGHTTALGIGVPFAGDDIRGAKSVLRRRRGQRCLFRSQSDTGLAPLQSPDRAGYLAHLAGPTRGVLHEGDFIGGKHKRFGFQDGLSKARKRRCGKDQRYRKSTPVFDVQPSRLKSIIAHHDEKLRAARKIFLTHSKCTQQGSRGEGRSGIRTKKGRRDAGLSCVDG